MEPRAAHFAGRQVPHAERADPRVADDLVERAHVVRAALHGRTHAGGRDRSARLRVEEAHGGAGEVARGHAAVERRFVRSAALAGVEEPRVVEVRAVRERLRLRALRASRAGPAHDHVRVLVDDELELRPRRDERAHGGVRTVLRVRRGRRLEERAHVLHRGRARRVVEHAAVRAREHESRRRRGRELRARRTTRRARTPRRGEDARAARQLSGPPRHPSTRRSRGRSSCRVRRASPSPRGSRAPRSASRAPSTGTARSTCARRGRRGR